MKKDSAELDQLLAAVSDGRATDAQVQELEKLILEDQEVCDAYLQYIDLHATLAEDCVGQNADDIVAFPQHRTQQPSFQVLTGAVAGIVAAMIVAGMLWIAMDEPEPVAEAPAYVAVVTHADGALWEGEDASVIIGSALEPGLLEICEGRMELELDNGVHIALEGPVRFRLINENQGELLQGKFSARVPPQGSGYRVTMPGMEVIDLGTEFGLNVSDLSSEVHVFKGEVEAILKDGKNRPRKELLTSSLTRRVQRDGSALEVIPFEPTHFVPPPESITGVSRISGGIRVLRMPPESVQTGTYLHNYILLFQEQRQVELEDVLEVSLNEPGRYQVGFAGEDFRHELGVGARVDSYFLHFDTKTKKQTRCRGTVRFDQPIVAVIAGADQLVATDELLGSWCTTYDQCGELSRQLENDHVIISGDRKTLTLDWGVSTSADQIRVLVQAPEWHPK